MDFKFTDAQEKLRIEVHAFLDDELKKGNFQTH